jgi:hypothetical protein
MGTGGALIFAPAGLDARLPSRRGLLQKNRGDDAVLVAVVFDNNGQTPNNVRPT